MASYSTGITVTWDGVPFSEVSGLSYTLGGSPAKGRAAPWTDEVGSVTVECLGTANCSTANYGLRKQIVISGEGQSLTSYAIYESIGVANEVNGVTRFTVTLKLMDS